jgi:hypothetical protein
MFKRVSAFSRKTRNFDWWKNFLSYKEWRAGAEAALDCAATGK